MQKSSLHMHFPQDLFINLAFAARPLPDLHEPQRNTTNHIPIARIPQSPDVEARSLVLLGDLPNVFSGDLFSLHSALADIPPRLPFAFLTFLSLDIFQFSFGAAIGTVIMFEVATSMTWLSQSETYMFLGIQTLCVLSAWVIASRDQEAKAEERAKQVGKKA